jgi:hypothetical protein
VLRGCNDDFEDWTRGGCGADLVLLRRFESCEDVPLRCIHSGAVWCGGGDDGTGEITVLGWDNTGAGAGVLVVT